MTEPKSYHFKSYRFGQFVVDRRSACLRCDGAVLPLRPKSFDVLVYLVQHPGRLVPKAELIDSVWQSVNVTENSLVQCIKEIRQALQRRHPDQGGNRLQARLSVRFSGG